MRIPILRNFSHRRTIVISCILAAGFTTGVLLVVLMPAEVKTDISRAMSEGRPLIPYMQSRAALRRIEAAKSLREGDEEWLRTRLTHSDSEIRRVSLMTLNFGLAKTEPETVNKAALEMLDDPDDHVKSTALIIAYKRDPSQFPQLRDKFNGSKSDRVRMTIEMLERQYASPNYGLPPK